MCKHEMMMFGAEEQLDDNSLNGKWKEDPNGLNGEMGTFEFILFGNGENIMVLWKRDYAPIWSMDRYANNLLKD